jgi:hypothetical protein
MSDEVVAHITLDDLPDDLDLSLPFDDTAITGYQRLSPERQRIEPQGAWYLNQSSREHLDGNTTWSGSADQPQYDWGPYTGTSFPTSTLMPELYNPIISPDLGPYDQPTHPIIPGQSQHSQDDPMIQSDPRNSPWYSSRSSDLLDQISCLSPPVPAQIQGYSLDPEAQHVGSDFPHRTMHRSEAIAGTLHDPPEAGMLQPQWPTVGVSGFISGSDVISGPFDDASQHSLLRLQYHESSVGDTASFAPGLPASDGTIPNSIPSDLAGGFDSRSENRRSKRPKAKSAGESLPRPVAEPIPYCTLRLLAEWLEQLESKTLVSESVEKRLATLLKASTRRFLNLYCLRDFEEWARKKAGLAEDPAIRICGYCYYTYGQFYPTRSNNYEKACECHQVKSLYFQKHAQVYRDAGKSTWRPIHPPQDVQGSEATVLSECDLGNCTVYT